jgi:hypothetical protein
MRADQNVSAPCRLTGAQSPRWGVGRDARRPRKHALTGVLSRPSLSREPTAEQHPPTTMASTMSHGTPRAAAGIDA